MSDYIIHEAQPGETWDGLALRYYYDEFQMTRLLDANPTLSSVVVFDGTEEVRVPVVDVSDLDVPAPSDAPWRRNG